MFDALDACHCIELTVFEWELGMEVRSDTRAARNKKCLRIEVRRDDLYPPVEDQLSKPAFPARYIQYATVTGLFDQISNQNTGHVYDIRSTMIGTHVIPFDSVFAWS
jgi:hypothetical protein